MAKQFGTAVSVNSRTYSTGFLELRRVIFNAMTSGENVSVSTVKQAVTIAYKQKKITETEYYDLISYCNTYDSVHSEEFTRLNDLIEHLKSMNGFISESDRNEISEEIKLATSSGLLSDGEVKLLADALYNSASKTVDMSHVFTSRDTPMRRKAAEKRAKHSDGYSDLLDSYKELYFKQTDENMEARVRRFFRMVEESYRQGKITIKEYRDFHGSLDDDSMFLYRLHIDTSSADYSDFKALLLDLMSDEGEVIEVMRQVGGWAKKHGTPESLIRRNLPALSTEKLPDFFESGQMLATVMSKKVSRENLLEMKLS